MYLTARAIGQSATTRNYLTSLQQDGSVLPQGPIIMSPDRLIYSFKREVIYKRPEVIKRDFYYKVLGFQNCSSERNQKSIPRGA